MMKRAISLLLVFALLATPLFALAEEAANADEGTEASGAIVLDPEEEAQLDDITEVYEGAKASLAEMGDMTNILLIGMDRRPYEKASGRSDTMILMTLDKKHNCIKLTSFLRDLYVEIPGRKNNRLNAAIVFGGPELLKQTLANNFGAQIDYYVGVNFSLLASVIDQIGGLTLTVEKRYVPRINAIIKMDNKVLGIDIQDGLLDTSNVEFVDGKADIHLTGKQSEAWARFRYGVPGDGDFDRSDRQRVLILKAMEKLQAMSLPEMISLAMNNMDQVTTDMSLIDLMTIAPAAFQLRNADVRQLVIPLKGEYRDAVVSKMAVYLPDRAANMKAFTEFILAE